MNIYDLVIEITRRCNAHCDHCLRGDAQNVDMDDKIIDAMLEGVDYISSVTFSGGEPSLAVPKIKYFLEAVKERNISLGSFYLVTNGKIKSLELVLVLMELYAYCDDIGDEFYGGFCISKDQFHEYAIGDVSEADKLYRSLSFYHPDERIGELKNESLINEGRSIEYGLGVRTVEPDSIEIEIDGEHIDYIESSVYVNALGDVVSGCNFSFESQEEYKIGNVLNNTIEEIYLRSQEEVEA